MHNDYVQTFIHKRDPIFFLIPQRGNSKNIGQRPIKKEKKTNPERARARKYAAITIKSICTYNI